MSLRSPRHLRLLCLPGFSKYMQGAFRSTAVTRTSLPAGTLYMLNNLSRGKDIRVFSYDNGVQEWGLSEEAMM